MMEPKFTLVLGGKSLAKSIIADYIIQKVENEKNSKLTILNVNMREQGSKKLFQAIFDSVKSKSQMHFQDVLKRVVVLAVGLAIGREGSGVGAGAAAAVAQGTLNFLDAVLPSDQKEQALSAIIAEIAKIGNKTCILADEANMAVPGDDEAEARNALQYFVMLTKEKKGKCGADQLRICISIPSPRCIHELEGYQEHHHRKRDPKGRNGRAHGDEMEDEPRTRRGIPSLLEQRQKPLCKGFRSPLIFLCCA